MLCARSFKNHSDVAPKITHFSPSHASLSHRHPRQNPPHKDSFLPHQPSFLSRRYPLQNVLRSPTRSSHPLQGSPFQQVSNPFQHPFRCFPKRPSQTSQSPLRIPLIRCATTIPAVKRSFFVCGSRDAGQIARGVPGGV